MVAGSDSRADAPLVSAPTLTEAFLNVGYTLESGEAPLNPTANPASEWFGATGYFTRSAWWKLTAPVGTAVQVHTQRSTYDPAYWDTTYTPDVLVQIYQGNAYGGLVLVGQGSLADTGPASAGLIDTIGNTSDWTPWLANFIPVVDAPHYIRISSIYDEPINYRLTVVPVPTGATSSWLDAAPVEIETTDYAHEVLAVGNHSGAQAGSMAAAVAMAWAGGFPEAILAPDGDTLARAYTGSTGLDEDGVTWNGQFRVWWYGVISKWPDNPTYTQVLPIDEEPRPAWASVEWAPLAGPVSKRLTTGFSVPYTDPPNPDYDTGGVIKIGAYNVYDPAATPPTYNPGFMTRAALAALPGTVAVGRDAEYSYPIPVGTESVALVLMDEWTATGTLPVTDGAWNKTVFNNPAQIYSTAIPHYRYAYAEAPVTSGPPPLEIVGQLDKTRVRFL